MIDVHAAGRRVAKFLNSKYPRVGDELVILEDRTVVKAYGWVFFYNTRRFVETGNFLHALGGNGPVVYERASGDIVELPSHSPPDVVLREYEERSIAVRD